MDSFLRGVTNSDLISNYNYITVWLIVRERYFLQGDNPKSIAKQLDNILKTDNKVYRTWNKKYFTRYT